MTPILSSKPTSVPTHQKLRFARRSWIPLHGLTGAFYTFLCRLITKVSVDFTATGEICASREATSLEDAIFAARRRFALIFPPSVQPTSPRFLTYKRLLILRLPSLAVQFRHQNEIGGLYWSLTILATCAIGFISALLHGDSEVTLIMGSSCAGMFIIFAIFLSSINPEYISTFTDTRINSESAADIFFRSEGDEKKFRIFLINEKLWCHIRDDVKTWLNSRLASWVKEEPRWLHDYNRSVIPDWAVYDKGLLARIRNEAVEVLREDRRRSSVAGLIEARKIQLNIK